MSVPDGVAPALAAPEVGGRASELRMGLDDGPELSLEALRRAVRGPLDRVPVEECQQDLGLVGEASGHGEDRGAEALLPELALELAGASLGLGQPLGDALLLGERRVLGRLLGLPGACAARPGPP